ncbi:VOC family protein [Flexibacterium corallicola]|uniref:VOC family protein n=1 Tax=Flexibacterium corallicola TaxID=3037259 RepID=UPI00286F607C|nr:VOC family protein [Pseudovibrio sp. M1P-2-3]
MSENNFRSLVSVVHVADYAEAIEWYTKWLGREPDITPTEGVGEWQLTDNAWIQISVAPDPSLVGKSSVVCGVLDLEVQCRACQQAGVAIGETQDYGFIKLASVSDPAGNTVAFVQEVEQA